MVSDLPRAAAFYRRILGLEKGRVIEGEWVEFHAPGIRIALHPSAIADRVNRGGASIGLRVEDLAAARQTLEARGVEFAWDTDENGVLLAGFEDPDGHPIYLVEHVRPIAELGDRFEDALAWAARLHRNQRRKGGGSPYVSHLLGVASLVLEHGGGEDEAIAALLHDAVEDQGGPATLEAIRGRYGDVVARVVMECSDTDEDPKPHWRQRKEAYLAALPDKSVAAHLVSACDKVHNATRTAEDLENRGESVWEMFNAGAEEQRWWYSSLYRAFSDAGKAPEDLVMKLRAAVLRLGCDLDS